MTDCLVTDRILAAGTHTFAAVGEAGQRDVCDMLRQHGFDPNTVHAVGYDVIDCPMLQIEVILQRDGRAYLEHGDDTECPDPLSGCCHHVAMRTVDVLLRGELPAWWRPGETP